MSLTVVLRRVLNFIPVISSELSPQVQPTEARHKTKRKICLEDFIVHVQ